MDTGAWKAAVGWTRLSDLTFTFHSHALEKEMATHCSVLAWRIPGTGEPGELPSMGSHSRTRLKGLSSNNSVTGCWIFCSSNFLWSSHFIMLNTFRNLSRKCDCVAEHFMVCGEMITSTLLKVTLKPGVTLWHSFLLFYHRCSKHSGDGCGKFCKRRWSWYNILLQVRQESNRSGRWAVWPGNVVLKDAGIPHLLAVNVFRICD